MIEILALAKKSRGDANPWSDGLYTQARKLAKVSCQASGGRNPPDVTSKSKPEA